MPTPTIAPHRPRRFGPALGLLWCLLASASGLEAQTPGPELDLFEAAYAGLLVELPEGPHAVVDDAGSAASFSEDAPSPEERARQNHRLAERLGLPAGPLETFMVRPEDFDVRVGYVLTDDLVALVSFTVHSASEGAAIVLADVWRTGEEGYVAVLGGYKGFRIQLAREGDDWQVEDVSVFIDS